VCFDLGGVLIRICRSWQEGCVAAGLDLRGALNAHDSIAGWYAPREVTDLYQTGRITCDQFATQLADAFGNHYSPDEIMRVHHAWMLGECAGVGAVIHRIHQAGLRTAALSNTNAAHWQRLPEFAAFASLQHRLASHELGLAKPDEAIYREAERRLGLSGSSILFFDDLSENIEAARTIGWRTAHIDHTGNTAQQIEAGLREHGVVG
jgi:HAD superfamily hydrolase (TIGR01509 family)